MHLRNLFLCVLFAAGILPDQSLSAEKPNVLVIWGDDIGYWNLSCNNDGMMGYRTPNIDRIAKEGLKFTDYYGEQSCTAGRAAFITGQIPIRTGLTKVGFPGAALGLQKEDPTIAEMLKPLGYATGQFGKNHLGDRDEYLPTNHGFDEFFGNLYHLNAEEEPEHPEFPKSPEFLKRYGPRGVIKSSADGEIRDTGPLTKKRMETVDEEFLDASVDFITRQHKAGKPFFCWFNASRMHYYTHIGKQWEGKSGLNFYADGMLQHDSHVGTLLNLLDKLKISENTIVIYSTDNGPHFNQWPDGGISPFRGEKNTNWEGGFRVPCAVRWPSRIEANTVINHIVSHQDWAPTLLAAAGESNMKERLLKGTDLGDKNFKVHLDGYNILPYLTGEKRAEDDEDWPRKEFFYFSDDGELLNIRYLRWKAVFAEQVSKKFDLWRDPFVKLRAPKLFDLRMDPFERGDTDSNNWNKWWGDHAFLLLPTQDIAMKFLSTFREFPPRQKPAAFNLDRVLQEVQKAPAGK